jgi:hypothetical protein
MRRLPLNHARRTRPPSAASSAIRSADPARRRQSIQGETIMRSILLWLLGVPIPIIILIALFAR